MGMSHPGKVLFLRNIRSAGGVLGAASVGLGVGFQVQSSGEG